MYQSSNVTAFEQLELAPPKALKKTVVYKVAAFNRKANDALRTRKYMHEEEINLLRKVARAGRYGKRDDLMILMCFLHGFRVSELCDLQWTDINFKAATLHVRRVKNSIDSTHPLQGKEIRALRALHRQNKEGPFVFVSERGGPITTAGFRKQLSRWGVKAKIGFPVHPHMLRHACGYALANK